MTRWIISSSAPGRPTGSTTRRWVGIGFALATIQALLLGAQAAIATVVIVGSVLVVVGVGFGELPGRRPLSLASPLVAVVLFAIVFQAAHFLEHGIQVGHWLASPTAPPYLTPWAAEGASAAAAAADGRGAVGVELLHLVGNGVFLVGLAALPVAAGRRALDLRSMPWTRRALIWQGAHVAEHVLLVATVLATGTAGGLSTGFGLLGADPLGWSVRIWLHFLINAAATIAALLALREARRHGLLGPGGGAAATAAPTSAPTPETREPAGVSA